MDPISVHARPVLAAASGRTGAPDGWSAPLPGVAGAPEHDWTAAAALLFPIFRPAGTRGTPLSSRATPTSAAGDTKPLIDPGPADLVVAYAISAAGFDILANGDHLAAWSVAPAALREAAFRNLAAWSAGAPWSEEVAGERRILSSDTGDGWDAARILLPEVTSPLAKVLGEGGARVLVGVPARHLLLAGSLGRTTPSSRRCSRISCGTTLRARTSRSTGGSSNWSTGSSCRSSRSRGLPDAEFLAAPQRNAMRARSNAPSARGE